MAWWGKIVGGAFGFMLGGPLGAVLGAAMGHQVDSGLGSMERDEDAGTFGVGDQERVQSAFFTASFSIMGHVAKADGKVTPDEIRAAEQVMAQMQLDEAQRKAAIALFQEGKQPGFPLKDVVKQFRAECHRRRNLIQMFIEIQLFAAYADGEMDLAERKVLADICRWLGFSQIEFARLEAMARAQSAAGGGAQDEHGRSHSASGMSLDQAYEILGVEPAATAKEIKRAYRRLTSQHHPDKLVSKGLPEEMMKMAAKKTHEIRKAYELIKERKGL